MALAGIAGRVAKLLGHYIAGFFSRDIPQALLWNYDRMYTPKETTTRYRGTYRAPSCSWASMIGETCVSDRSGGRTNVKALAKLVDFHLDLVDENAPYGQLRAAEITLEAGVVRAKLLQRDRQGHHAKFHMWHIRMALANLTISMKCPKQEQICGS